MNIHEYQAKELLKKFGVPIANGKVAFSVNDATAAAREIGAAVFAVKAQIHAGGRGKGGGVKIAKSIDEVRQYADDILGINLVTHQTGPKGQKVRSLYIEEGADIDSELYFSILIDRKTKRIVAIASTEGGVDIEEVAATKPEAIVKVFIDPITGFQGYHARQLAFALGLSGDVLKAAVKFFANAYEAFTSLDANLLEVNPLVITKSEKLLALDAKMTFDDNALFRHSEVAAMRDRDEEEPMELEAKNHDLSYIKLEGSIGCMVNGAGLAMATMDVIKLFGGEPANFLDVGGGANQEKVSLAFKLILSDPQVEAILVNIFGGIMRCDVIAEGIVAAAKEVEISIPLVVRLEGTNVDLGKKILAESGLKIMSAEDLGDAAFQVVKAIKEAA